MPSQPAAQPSQPSQPLSGFDPEIFWALHKQKILVGAAVLIVVLLGGSIYFGLQAVKTQKAEAAYSAANSIEGWQALIGAYPGSIAAGNSYLMIGLKMREASKYPESDTAYDSFVHRFPKHPLQVAGYMGLAANAELENHPDKALDEYKEVATQFNSSYLAPMALFQQARLTEVKGELKEAQQLFESIVRRYPESTFSGEAGRRAGRLADKLSQETPKPNSSAQTTSSPLPSPTSAKSPEP
jgi:outer membrane protein assembly factor BamD (BamD/ComL family)